MIQIEQIVIFCGKNIMKKYVLLMMKVLEVSISPFGARIKCLYWFAEDWSLNESCIRGDVIIYNVWYFEHSTLCFIYMTNGTTRLTNTLVF